MTRPIVWVLGTLGAVAVAATVAVQRLADLAPARDPARPASASVATPAKGPRPSGVSQAGRTTVLDGDRAGHFQAEVSIEGRRIPMMVDTGASIVALTYEDAALAGIRPFPSDFTAAISTANGQVAFAPVRLREVRVGDITVRDVAAMVAPRGRLGTSLLGMSFLKQLRSFEVVDNRLTLRG